MTQGFDLSPAEKSALRWANLVSVYQNVDRVMSGQDVIVECVHTFSRGAEEIAFTDLAKNRITLNGSKLDIESLDGLAATTAVNYHELCHVMMTPLWLFDDIKNSSSSKGQFLHYAFNVLEDQRIEMQFVDKYAVAKSYFTKMIISYILDQSGDADQFITNMLIYGRRYLPDSIRGRALVSTTDNAMQVRGIIDEYTTLDLAPESPDEDRAMPLIEQLATLLYDMYHNSRQKFDSGCVAGGSPQRGRVPAPIDRDMERALAATAAEIDVELFADALEYRKEITGEPKASNLARHSAKPSVVHQDVPAAWMQAANRMSEEFLRICTESEPYWDAGHSYGRLNARRAAAGYDPTELFDDWTGEVAEDTSLEVVVLSDHSTSMRDAISTVSLSLWALKRSVEHVDGRVTAIGFDTNAYVLYDDKPALPNKYNQYEANGNTDPSEALNIAHTVLATSKRANKLLLVATDGAWCTCHHVEGGTKRNSNYSTDCAKRRSDAVVERIGKGATTALFFLSRHAIQNPDPHGCQTAAHVTTPELLHKGVEKMVTDMMRKSGKL